MSLGTGIFLSAVLLSIVGLYAATKDRWRWKRIARWTVAVPIILVAVFGGGVWVHSLYSDRPVAQEHFEGLRLGAARKDVKFLKGAPLKSSTEDVWQYDAHSGGARPEDALLIVRFRDDKIRYVAYWANENQVVRPYLLGFTIGSDYGPVLEALGQPSTLSTDENGFRRIASFDGYSVFYEFERGKVRAMGVFDPAMGPIVYNPSKSD